MKRCPSCNRTYTDLALNFCLEDGTPLLSDAKPTELYAAPRNTSEPPPTEIYRTEAPLLNQVSGMTPPRPAPQWPAPPHTHQVKKSNAVWWVLGGIAVVGIIGIGLIIMIVAVANIDTNQNNANDNTNSVVSNRDRNSNSNSNSDNTNADSNIANANSTRPAVLSDDFASQKWRTGTFQFGEIWYADEEFHMRAKEKMYLVMYAPPEYTTQNARVRVTARSVDGVSPASGYGLVVHGEKSSDNALEDYALLIYTGSDPRYQVVLHKNGIQTTLVPWTRSSTIRPGTNPNQLEIRSKGDELSFYINGRYLTRLTDTENNKRGLAGLYTSETGEVAFDDLEIAR